MLTDIIEIFTSKYILFILPIGKFLNYMVSILFLGWIIKHLEFW